MRKLSSFVFSVLLASSAAHAFEGQRTFMPPNDLDLAEVTAGGITEAQFNGVIDKAIRIYGPIFSHFGATLKVNRLWSDATVNASAEQPTATSWVVNMYGGLARRAEVTEDGFAMVLCHEMGHHLGGFPYVQDWAANEGQSDMHATGACASKLFGTNVDLSAVANEELPADLKAKCDASHPQGERDICYRAIVAGKSLADLLAALGGTAANYGTPDRSVVTRTNNAHPAAQCRLDSYIAGAICGASKWDYNLIPGKSFPNRNSLDAQNEAYAHSCAEGDGARPKCWFAPVGTTPDPGGECPIQDPVICELLCQLDPTQPWCH